MADKDFELGKSDLPGVETREVPVGDSSRTGYFIAGTDIELEPQGYETAISEGQSDYTRTGYNVYDEEQEGIHVFSPAGEYEGFQYAPRKDGFGAFFGDVLETVGPILSLIPATAPYMAAVNAARAAKEGDWGKAALYALPAAGKFAGAAGATADTVSALNEANKYAKILKSLEDKNLLNLAFQGADLSGVKELAGYDLGDVKKAVNLGMAIKNEDPMALIRAGMAYVPKAGSGKLGFDVDDRLSDAEPFAVQQGDTFGGGYVDMSAPDQGEVDLSEFLVRPTPIEIPEIVSEPEMSGMVITAPRPEPEFDLSEFLVQPTPIEIPEIVSEPEFPEMVVTAPRPEYPQIELTPEDLAPPEIIPTPIDIPPIVGPTPAPAPKPPAAPATKPPAAPFDLSGLLLLLGGQQQGPIPLTVPDNAADIKLMEEIFGTSLSAPSTGNETDKAALARLLRS